MPRGVKTSKRLPFKQAIANEKSDQPLAYPEVASSVLRRMFFEGEILTPEAGQALGGTDGLVGACVRSMQDWGYEFERIQMPNGKMGFQLLNPGHDPVERITREPGPSRPRAVSPALEELREALLGGAEISIAQTLELGASPVWLTKEISKLKKEGFEFRVEGAYDERKFKLIRRPPAKRGRPKGSTTKKQPGSEIEQQPLPNIGLANGNGKEVAASVASMLFGDSLATPTPKLGDHIRVMGLLLDDDDQVTMVMKGGGVMWKTKVEGFADAD